MMSETAPPVAHGRVSADTAAIVDPNRHANALEREAVAALAAKDLQRAFPLADRRCRILPVAEARHYTLRGEIAHQSGFHDAALADIAFALSLAPSDLAANRRMMEWGSPQDQRIAATRLMTIDRDFNVLATAVTILKCNRKTTFGAIRRVGDSITGWVAWQGKGNARLRVSDRSGTEMHGIASDPEHFLAHMVDHASNINMPFAASELHRSVALLVGQHKVAEATFPAPVSVRGQTITSRLRPATRKSGMNKVTVIVPIYDDFEATRRCLETLSAALADDRAASVLLVDDATPDPRIAALLDDIIHHPQFTLLRNTENLGFIGAVNRALDEVSSDDIVLLNADTAVPKGFVRRLRAAAYSEADIGTVTPLSNNGEGTSMPMPFVANPLLPQAEIERIDSLAAEVNAGSLVEITNGIGFCLYVTRACLNAVGKLSDHYHRGYLEDVDLCLRAKELGFRNVCLPSLYVGHAGSASFKTEKRALVMLNLERLRQRFPDYRRESGTFKALDPLRESRSKLEHALLDDCRGATLVVTGPGVAEEVAIQFARACSKRGRTTLVAKLVTGHRGNEIAFCNINDGFPQSLRFEWPSQTEALTELAAKIAPARIVVADPARIPRQLVETLAVSGSIVDLLVADGGLWCRRGGIGKDQHLCSSLTKGAACRCDTSGFDWLAQLPAKSHIIAADPAAEAMLRRTLSADLLRHLKPAQAAKARSPLQRPIVVGPRGKALGLILVGQSPSDFAFASQLARHMQKARPEIPIVIFGETLNDLNLMAIGNVTVTGKLAPEELSALAVHYGLGGLAIARRAPLFGHPVIAAAFNSVSVPLAFVDWSHGEHSVHSSDIALAPALTDEEIIAALDNWTATRW